MPARLILASTSAYRRALLARLSIPFEVAAPAVDETALPGETPAALARRLAGAKCRAVAAAAPGAVVIGADQVASLGEQVLGKPGTAARARAQLRAASGRTVTFLTAVSVAAPAAAAPLEHVDVTEVVFRRLDAAGIARYVEAEAPLDCAGSFKAEGLGIALFEEIRATDPTALIGLPLIWLAGALRRSGYSLP